jgi:general secretion pathway protein D
MRFTLSRLAMLAVVVALSVLFLTPTVQAQVPGQFIRPTFVNAPTTTQLNIQTTVTIPDGGSVLVGGYSRMSEGRNEFGVPVLGKVPYLAPGFRNVGYGRDVKSVRVIASVRIINLEEEEYRQTGVRSGR